MRATTSVILSALSFLSAVPLGLLACGGSTPAAAVDGGPSVDGGASVDGGSSVDGGASDGGAAQVFTPASLGRFAYDVLKRNSFSDFYTTVLASRDEVKASCPGLSVDARYAAGGDLSQTTQLAAFNDCRSRLNILQTDLADVRVVPQVAALNPPSCNAAVPRATVTIEARTRSGASFFFTLADVMTFDAGARLFGKLRDCGSAGVLSDGGAPPPQITLSASPASPRAGDAVSFTASIVSGAPPYLTCTWRYLAGDNPVAGAIAGSTCTGQYTYPTGGDFVVSVEVGDSAGRTGMKAQSFTIQSTTQPGPPDLIVRGESFHTVDPPPQNRYPQGGVVNVTFVAKNIGAGDAAATTVRILLRDPVGRSQTPLGNVDIAALPAGQEAAITRAFQIPASQPTLVYDLVANINPDRTLVEANTSNDEVTFLWVEVVAP